MHLLRITLGLSIALLFSTGTGSGQETARSVPAAKVIIDTDIGDDIDDVFAID